MWVWKELPEVPQSIPRRELVPTSAWGWEQRSTATSRGRSCLPALLLVHLGSMKAGRAGAGAESRPYLLPFLAVYLFPLWFVLGWNWPWCSRDSS